MPFTLRPVASTDDDFLYRLYEATHGQQFTLLPLAPAQLEALLQMQFHAQRSGYRQQYPASEDFIILIDGQPAGRVWLDDSQPLQLHLLDIALLTQQQGGGTGTAVLRQAMEQAALSGKHMHLHVARMNVRAFEFYRRLGFEVTGGDEVYIAMRCQL